MLTLDEIGLKYTNDTVPLSGVKYSGGDKVSQDKKFTLIYDTLFNYHFPSSFRTNKSFRILELGVLYGRSSAMFCEYIQGEVHGLDRSLSEFTSFRPKLEAAGAFKNKNLFLHETDLKDEKLKSKISKFPKFDIIIDDAVHKPEIQYNNFKILWSKLNKGGIYIIEDITEPDTFLKLFSGVMANFLNPSKGKSSSVSSSINSIQCYENLFIIVRH